ncbi:MAG: succinylglutamate desuccinylase/aspartoacylase family protein [Verrucomicrobiota bacterium]
MSESEKPSNNQWLVIDGEEFPPGSRGEVSIHVGELIHHQPVTMPVHVHRGRKPGPYVFISAAVHGDEVNGVEIIRRLLNSPSIKRLRGTLLAVPVVNMPAFLVRSRYLPDRRDMNRLFPGSDSGSLGARIADAFCREVLDHCDFGLDLHTGAVNRPNLPQIRISGKTGEEADLAKAFGAAVVLTSPPREGSLRAAAAERDIPYLLYEAGEATQLDEASVKLGLRGTLNVLRHLGMIPQDKARKRLPQPIHMRSSYWERAASGGVFIPRVKLGKAVSKDMLIGIIADPFSAQETPSTRAPMASLLDKPTSPSSMRVKPCFTLRDRKTRKA